MQRLAVPDASGLTRPAGSSLRSACRVGGANVPVRCGPRRPASRHSRRDAHLSVHRAFAPIYVVRSGDDGRDFCRRRAPFCPAVLVVLKSQIASCQNQLRLIGFGLQGYSDLQADHSFPGRNWTGNPAAAGIVAPLLVSHQLADSRMFLCPASSVAARRGWFPVVVRLPPGSQRLAGDRCGVERRVRSAVRRLQHGLRRRHRLLLARNSQRIN